MVRTGARSGRISEAQSAAAYRRNLLLLVLAAALVAACGPSWSPERDRTASDVAYELTPEGEYRVRRGDSLYTIAFRMGLDWRNLAEWNGIGAPYTIYPDQELRLSPPPRVKTEAVTRPARSPSSAVSADRPSVSETGTASTTTPVPVGGKASAADAAASSATAPSATANSSVPTAAGQDPASWLWPTEGRVLSTFKPNDPSRNGIEIGGTEGQSVIAAAAGEVVYSGSGLIGYGELIIVKHSDRMLSAYAHNRNRLVTEGQRVAAGDRLAEMGRDERNRPMLHFEIRVNGTPQDPLRFLPGR